MHYRDVPASQHVALVNSNADLIASALERIVGMKHFVSSAVITDAPRSGRLLYTMRVTGDTPLPDGSASAIALAIDIVILSEEARYYPVTVLGKSKGWEVRRTLVRNQPAAILWTAWV